MSFNRTSFQQQLKRKTESISDVTKISFNRTSFQQQLKLHSLHSVNGIPGFNRTSFQQQLKLVLPRLKPPAYIASIVHPFNNN